MTNEAFFNKYAKMGAVGLVGGTALVDKTIKKAQKKITANKLESHFSHAFIFSEKRPDKKWWLIESDLEFHSKQIKLGVQENRIDKYFDLEMYPNVAVMDFNLDSDLATQVVAEGLNLVSERAKYSIREIFGVLLSFTKKELRQKENVLAQDNSFICSAFVQHCYKPAGVLFNKSVALKNLTPEDIYSTASPHNIEKLIRHK